MSLSSTDNQHQFSSLGHLISDVIRRSGRITQSDFTGVRRNQKNIWWALSKTRETTGKWLVFHIKFFWVNGQGWGWTWREEWNLFYLAVAVNCRIHHIDRADIFWSSLGQNMKAKLPQSFKETKIYHAFGQKFIRVIQGKQLNQRWTESSLTLWPRGDPGLVLGWTEVISLSWRNTPCWQINYVAKDFTIVLYTRSDIQ